MKVLVTGDKGFVGSYVAEALQQKHCDVTGCDIKDGYDIRDYRSLRDRATDCEVIIHLAAVDNDDTSEIVDTNIIGTINVLNIYRELNISKLIFMSSVDSLGIFQGEGKPKYLPIDDEYPCHPDKPYSLSKYINERLCNYYFSLCNRPILCIRAPGIWNEETYETIIKRRKERPGYEWDPYWEYGAFIDVRDLSEAIYKSVIVDFAGFHCYLIAADDITTSGKTSKELVDFIYPGIEWKADDLYITSPYKTILKNEKIKKLLGWNPKYSWSDYVRKFA